MNLYDYMFWFNPYEKLWFAFKREDYIRFFNGELKDVMSHENIEALILKITDEDFN